MRLIFLDIDGVLNSTRTAVAYKEPLLRRMDPISVILLHQIVEASEAKIVVSSTWRYYSDWLTLVWGCLREAGWPNVGEKEMPLIARTGIADSIRGQEIKDFLATFDSKVDDYIILDDSTDMLPEQKDHFYKCDPHVGLGYEQWDAISKRWGIHHYENKKT